MTTSKNESLRSEYGLTEAEADVVLRRTADGGDVDAAAAQIKSERVGPAATPEGADTIANAVPDLPADKTPLVPPGDWPGPQGTDLPHPDQQVEQLEELADAGIRADNDPAKPAARKGSAR